MPAETTVAERLNRAKTQDMEARLVETDPQVVIEVENHDSEDEDSIYTVIPENGYCGCWDARARNVVCKHVLFLALQDGQVGEYTRNALTDTRDGLGDQVNALQDELQTTRAEYRAVRDALDALESDADDAERSDPDSRRDSGTLRSMVDRVTGS